MSAEKVSAENADGTRIVHFPNAQEAERFVFQEGFQYQGAPGHWEKRAGDALIRADIHISQHGAVVVIHTKPPLRPMAGTA